MKLLAGAWLGMVALGILYALGWVLWCALQDSIQATHILAALGVIATVLLLLAITAAALRRFL